MFRTEGFHCRGHGSISDRLTEDCLPSGEAKKKKKKDINLQIALRNGSVLHLKQLEKELKNPKISRRKEIIKIQAEINKKEMKETIEKINKN